MRRSGSRVCIHLYPLAIVLPPGQDSLLTFIVYIVGSHIVQCFVIAALVVVVDELGRLSDEQGKRWLIHLY